MDGLSDMKLAVNFESLCISMYIKLSKRFIIPSCPIDLNPNTKVFFYHKVSYETLLELEVDLFSN